MHLVSNSAYFYKKTRVVKLPLSRNKLLYMKNYNIHNLHYSYNIHYSCNLLLTTYITAEFTKLKEFVLEYAYNYVMLIV